MVVWASRGVACAGLVTMPAAPGRRVPLDRTATEALRSETDTMQKRLTELKMIMQEHKKKCVVPWGSVWSCGSLTVHVSYWPRVLC